MNANGLAKHYDKLSPWERVPAMIAAEARGDETEVQRLASSAPRVRYSVADCRDLWTCLTLLAHGHALEQLHFAALYWDGSAMLAEKEVLLNKNERKQRDKRLTELRRMLCFRAVRNADTWKLFCESLGIDPNALLCELPGFEVIGRFEEVARLLAFTPEEASAFVEKGLPPTGDDRRRVKITFATPEEEAQALRSGLEAHVAK